MLALSLLAVQLSGHAWARVDQQTEKGFRVVHTVTVTADASAAFERFVKIGSWWSKAHTYSGEAKNLKIDLTPGGCWCERVGQGGFVKHMEVLTALPGQHLAFQGGLGPLQRLGASGVMAVDFKTKDGKTDVSMVYTVTGLFDDKEVAGLAAAVDGVLGEQIKRYADAKTSGEVPKQP
ncbi:MAG TPA: ATPase [Alphaproteobacteria bacterium]|nr:ATPase [Alphaproteobacteria bacterium]HAJ46555.1 ATPase [Alphaproteobacteria bacterium]